MQALILLLARPLVDAFLSAFGHFVMNALRTWKASEDAQALGRAEAVRDAAKVVADVEREMGAVELPERDELLKRLREGLA